MKRVVLDTNVLVSATFWKGDSYKILLAAEKKMIASLTSKEIIDEFSRVLASDEIQEKIRDKELEMRMAVAKFVSLSTIIEPKEQLSVVKEDPDDDKFLECAVAGKADFIASQDKHLLKLKRFRGVKMVTPGEFLKEVLGC